MSKNPRTVTTFPTGQARAKNRERGHINQELKDKLQFGIWGLPACRLPAEIGQAGQTGDLGLSEIIFR
ncbi:MAG: hypothetical protein IIB44_13140 [Candidatus Marinimicrobia bacterium]|nr:hypothetical protein [Candidatus Neomarinimicrobiota bacterium]